MKGRANYACRQKIYDAEKEPVLDGPGRGRRFPDHPRVGEDHRDSATAPRSRRCRKHSTAWAKIDARSDLCTGQKCQQFERCFITLMHQRALRERHHHRQPPPVLRRPGAAGRASDGGILPEYHAVVFDEAHEIEDVAGQYFGVSVSNYRFQDLRARRRGHWRA